MKNDWSLWQHLRETLHQFVTVSGVMLLGSFTTTIYVAVAVPSRSLEWLVFWNVAMITNHTGRWILPQWFAVKAANGQMVPATLPPKG